MRIGARFPNAGSVPGRIGLAVAAQRLEAAGFDSLWTSDHLAMPIKTRSTYPFSDDGQIPWLSDHGWSDAIVSLAIAAAVTDQIELGTAVLVAPLRNPLVTAMQFASVSVEARGRCALGVGAGWLIEEFDAVEVPFSDRGKRLDAWIEVVRDAWSGKLPMRDPDDFYPNPIEMICAPVPAAPVPILVGGMTPAALRRAGRIGDGWVALQAVDKLDPPSLGSAIKSIQKHAREAGRDDSMVRVTLQITNSAGHADDIADHLSDLMAVGVQEIIVDVRWDAEDDPRKVHDTLRAAK